MASDVIVPYSTTSTQAIKKVPRFRLRTLWCLLTFICVWGFVPCVVGIHLENDLENFLQELNSNSDNSDVKRNDDDFAFDESHAKSEDESGEWSTSYSRVQRLWGIADIQAVAGRVFEYTLPEDAFSGKVDRYEVSSPQNTALPNWLHFDKSTVTFKGVPLDTDLGEHYVVVKAISDHTPQSVAKDVFSIEVVPPATNTQGFGTGRQVTVLKNKNSAKKEQQFVAKECHSATDRTILVVILDIEPESIDAEQRVQILRNMADFLNIDQRSLGLHGDNTDRDILEDENIILAGPGNAKVTKKMSLSALKWQVGCDGEVSLPNQKVLNKVKTSASDGSLAELLNQPVIGWQLRIESHGGRRNRRELGSGDDENEDDDSYDEFEEEDEIEGPEVRNVPTMASPTFTEVMASTATPPVVDSRAHRHHHGEGTPSHPHRAQLQSHAYHYASPRLYGTPIMTPTLDPVRPTLSHSDYRRVYEEGIFATPVISSEVEPTPMLQGTPGLPSLEPMSSWGSLSSSMDTSEEIHPTPTVTLPESTASVGYRVPNIVASPTVSTYSMPSETVEFETKNFPPTSRKLLNKQMVTAGKIFKIVLPHDLFTDMEDGDIRSLQLYFKTKNGTAVPSNSWIQLDTKDYSLYGLPFEDDVSRWEFIMEAVDSEGSNAEQTLEISVRQHQSIRSFHHRFGLEFRLEKKWTFTYNVDWELLVLDRLAKFFGDFNATNVFVLDMKMEPNVLMHWTNDSFSFHDKCPEQQIRTMFDRMSLNQDGNPTSAFTRALAPEITVKRVSLEMLGVCSGKSPLGILPSSPPSSQNYAPTLRNQVDQVNATAGEILAFQVPELFCYDPEDGNTRALKLTLLTNDRTSIPHDKWLQFDSKNQEFYGLPLENNVGREEYQLVCEDSGGLTAIDGLLVVVHPRPTHKKFNVEFALTINTSYSEFSQSASQKRKLMDKIAFVFGDKDASKIVVKSVEPGSVIFTWYNHSLRYEPCPEREITLLRRILLNDDGSLNKKVAESFAPEFNITHAKLVPIDMCLGELTPTHIPPPPPMGEEMEPTGTDDDYYITFIVPAVIIAAMLLLAAVIACILYRKRRRGKMSVDENKTFITKGIPIIFQDELEEKPDPAKSPVIMKEEKPPMPPPNYRHGDGSRSPSRSPPPEERSLLNANDPVDLNVSSPPYQPPPPFTTNRNETNRHNRPKTTTPAYRKPPPYVPP